jgi:predicted nuclease of restriction endonuclease-like (RecB) superfamily
MAKKQERRRLAPPKRAKSISPRRSTPPKRTRSISPRKAAALTRQASFEEVLAFIEEARKSAFQSVNTALLSLYWKLGEYIGNKLASSEWGDGVVDELASTIALRYPGMRGYTRRNLFRMLQFFEAYRGQAIVSAVLTQLPWTHHLIILSRVRSAEERQFYILEAVRSKWSSRELERQIRTKAFGRQLEGDKKVSAVLTQIHPRATEQFKNSYSLEFLGLSPDHSEADLHASLLQNLGRFIAELGQDFCFVGSQYPVQVGKQDFLIDLVFFHRSLSCLVAVELKVREFRPEDLGKLTFYLEALDRDARKEHERPSIGVLLCATKDNEVVEYALSRSLSPALVAEYRTALPSTKLLRRKLQELYSQLMPENPELPKKSGATPKRTKARPRQR